MENPAILEIKNGKIYQNKNLILDQVNVTIGAGEFVYLVGKTGSGKSSLLKTLYGELPLNDGEGTIVGYDLKKLKRKNIPYLRRKIGIVFQDFQLLPDRSVEENLKFVMKATAWKDKKKITDKVKELLERVSLTGKEQKLPHQLSGGEQQRVSIARALINDPVLILADEPTGNLDPETSEEILKLLFEISKNGRAVLMATHDYTIMEKFPFRTLKTENGKLNDVQHAAFFNPLRP
jgi:cell division transport system ATP-binding protein